jgi:hypothetical protein
MVKAKGNKKIILIPLPEDAEIPPRSKKERKQTRV